MSDVTKADLPSNHKLIAFRIGCQEFCVDIMAVREIRGWTQATPLPHAPSFVRGVINLRGTMLPVVDLAARLGFPPVEPTARHVIVVAQVAGRVTGLLVDAVSEVLNVANTSFQPTPDVASDATKAFIQGILAVEGRMISLISLNNILPAELVAA